MDGTGGAVFRFGSFVLDVADHSLTRDGEPITLAPKLFELLRVLASSGGRLLTKDALMQAVWPDTVVEEGNLSKGIFLLRQALGDTTGGAFIQTVPRIGYRFVAGGTPPTAPPAAETLAVPETRYAKSGDVHIAYQVTDGPGPDLVLVPGWVSHVEYAWEEPTYARFLRRLASFARLIILDRRGTGLSDRTGGLATIEQQIDDVLAVMDAAGSHRASFLGVSEGGPLGMLFAATHPERLRSLLLFGTGARWTRADDYPAGVPRAVLEDFTARVVAGWGTGVSTDVFAPSVAADASFRRSWGRFERFAVSPAGIGALLQRLWDLDVRDRLHEIRVPTLVLHRTQDDAVRVGNGRYLAAHIPAARYLEAPGVDHFPFVGDSERIAAAIESFVVGPH